MKPRWMLGAAILVALVLVTPAAQAKTYSARYLVPSPPGVLFTPPVCEPSAGIGGCAFAIGASETPTKVRVADDLTGLPVAFSVCQDVDGDTTCDLAREPYKSSCGADMILDRGDWEKGVTLTVFVKAIEPVLCSNENQALQGTITLTVD